MLPERALVTGASGFIGSRLVEGLSYSGYEVVRYGRSQNNEYVGDVCDRESLVQAVEGVRVIFHLAALTRSRDTSEMFRVNVVGTRSLLEVVSEYCWELDRFVLVSSTAAVGPNRSKPTNETTLPNPVSRYGLSKLWAEDVALRFVSHVPLTIARPAMVYGPGDRDLLAYIRIIDCLGVVLLPKDGVKSVSLIHVDDLTNAMCRMIEPENTKGQTYCLANEKPVALEQLGRLIAQVLNKKTGEVRLPVWLIKMISNFAQRVSVRRKPLLLTPDKVQELKQPLWECDSSKARREWGFSPMIGLEEGICQTIEWYKEHGWL